MSCISKINDTFEDNTEYLDIAMPMYNLLQYSGNYFCDITEFAEFSQR